MRSTPRYVAVAYLKRAASSLFVPLNEAFSRLKCLLSDTTLTHALVAFLQISCMNCCNIGFTRGEKIVWLTEKHTHGLVGLDVHLSKTLTQLI